MRVEHVGASNTYRPTADSHYRSFKACIHGGRVRGCDAPLTSIAGRGTDSVAETTKDATILTSTPSVSSSEVKTCRRRLSPISPTAGTWMPAIWSGRLIENDDSYQLATNVIRTALLGRQPCKLPLASTTVAAVRRPPHVLRPLRSIRSRPERRRAGDGNVRP